MPVCFLSGSFSCFAAHCVLVTQQSPEQGRSSIHGGGTNDREPIRWAGKSFSLGPLGSRPFEPEGLRPPSACPNKAQTPRSPTSPAWSASPIWPLLLPLTLSGPPWKSGHTPPCWSSNVPTLLTQLLPPFRCLPRRVHASSPIQVCAQGSPQRRVLPCPLILTLTHITALFPWPVLCLLTAAPPVPRIMPGT